MLLSMGVGLTLSSTIQVKKFEAKKIIDFGLLFLFADYSN